MCGVFRQENMSVFRSEAFTASSKHQVSSGSEAAVQQVRAARDTTLPCHPSAVHLKEASDCDTMLLNSLNESNIFLKRITDTLVCRHIIYSHNSSHLFSSTTFGARAAECVTDRDES
jgi:hypothetical protein